jgi:hypothetical protein
MSRRGRKGKVRTEGASSSGAAGRDGVGWVEAVGGSAVDGSQTGRLDKGNGTLERLGGGVEEHGGRSA